MADDTFGPCIGQIRLSRIQYECDLTAKSGRIIPLGAIAELTLGPVRAMGLIARTSLLAEEIDAIGQLYRARLAAPFDLLKDEFDWAWKARAAGEGIPALAARHTESLLFTTPTIERVTSVYPLAAPAFADLAVTELRRLRDGEFFSLLVDTWQTPKVVPEREDLSRLAA